MLDFLRGLLLDFLLGLLVLGFAVLIVIGYDPDLFHGSLWVAAIKVASVAAMVWFVGWYVLFRSGTRRIRDMDENHSNKTSGKDGL
jgi:hypothetical protein